MHSGWVNTLCMSPTLCDSACECAIICVWRWQHTECAASLQPQHQFPVYYIQSFILQASTEGLLVSAPRWNVHTCSEPLKHMNPISPFSRGGGGDWVECEHGRNLILQAVPLCLRRPLGTCWMELFPREEKRGRGEERRQGWVLKGKTFGRTSGMARVYI